MIYEKEDINYRMRINRRGFTICDVSGVLGGCFGLIAAQHSYGIRESIITHAMEKKTAPGHGSWHQCSECGATKHSGHWWLAGYKSKVEPPCSQSWPSEEWTDNAYAHHGKYQ